MATKVNHPNRGVDEVLKQTDIGEFIAKNKSLCMSLLALVAAAIIGYGFYDHSSKKSSAKFGNEIFDFETNKLKMFTEKKIKGAELVAATKTLLETTSYYEGTLQPLLVAADGLRNQELLKEARELLELAKDNFSNTNIYAKYLIYSRLAPIYEDLDQTKLAITLLEDLNQSNIKIDQERTYFDLGRMYQEVGDKEKAKLNLKYLIDNYADGEYSKIAKIVLERL